ncbi:hypothetical protein EDB92DRAFT_1091846 [Lactarius akahatsu]|uniref:Uncharacterized protein n=1 Tax=Lactarius akahatsu TaxID=416441 RepID=A0AAD4QBR7_9AGAM|nr:hypothetical protein EDB92DRAFT_1091846 [Lactarius akahatsu]
MPSVGSLLHPFGFCGDDTFCLGGCNPLASHSLNSCVPNPIRRSANYTFADQSRIYPNASLFDGNLAVYDWVLNQGDISNTNSSGGELVLMLTRDNGGTRISPTRYVHYGKITAMNRSLEWRCECFHHNEQHQGRDRLGVPWCQYDYGPDEFLLAA